LATDADDHDDDIMPIDEAVRYSGADPTHACLKCRLLLPSAADRWVHAMRSVYCGVTYESRGVEGGLGGDSSGLVILSSRASARESISPSGWNDRGANVAAAHPQTTLIP
jgi:hypothetical protein